MLFPKNTKVLVIDDVFDEVKPLLNALFFNGISYSYIDGNKDIIPSKKLSSVRIVILDIDLDGNTSSATDDKTKAAILANYLKQLIEKGTPYLILFWTKHDEICDNIVKYLEAAEIQPLGYINLEKPSKEELENLTIEEINEKLSKSTSYKGFNLLIDWENYISEKSSLFSNNFFKLVTENATETENTFDNSLKNIFGKFACAYTGNEKINENTKNMEYALSVFTKSFSESNILDKPIPTNDFLDSLNSPKISINTTAKLNTLLFTEEVNNNEITNGKLFVEENNDNLKNILIKNTLRGKLPEDIFSELIGVIVTPSCDIAHNKFLQLKSKNTVIKYHRVLYGLKIFIKDISIWGDLTIYEHRSAVTHNVIENCAELSDKLKEKLYKVIRINKPDNLFILEPLWDSEKNCIIIVIFNFNSFQLKEIESEIRFKCQLKESLMSDIQTKLANHINRLGNNMIAYKREL